MEKDLEDVGHHCQVSTCRQKDFLPFKCDICGMTLCLEHRTYNAHSCSGGNYAKSMTSVDCPVCGKSIKMAQSDRPDDIWETHYQYECTQSPASEKKQSKKCIAPSCRVNLGPSNTFQCPKCHFKVCLSHRLPDDHDCRGLKSSRISLAPAQPKTSAAKSPEKKDRSKSSKEMPNDNSIRGTVQRRMRTNGSDTIQSNPNVVESYICPICSLSFIEQDLLTTHLNFEHNDVGVASYTNNPQPISNTTRNQGSAGREVCPQCQMRFHDAVDLVAHVETAHNSTPKSICMIT